MADLNLDLSGIRQLREQIENFDNELETWLDRFVRQCGLKTVRLTKELTPVGDHPNHVFFYARKSKTNSEMNLVTLEGVGEGMVGGSLRNSWKNTQVIKSGDQRQITIFADSATAPYAIYVEHGHRTVAFNSNPPRTVGWWEGHHMAKDSIEIVDFQIPRAFEESFKRFTRRLGADNG